MRLKFFLITLGVLVATTVSLTGLLVYYFQDERMDFIDDQIRQTAAAIIDSKLSDLPAYDYEKVDSILSEELGPDRIGKFFIIRNKNGEVLFQTRSVDLMHLEIPRDPQWITIKKKNRLIRALNLQLPRSKTRTIQVGVITESSFFYWLGLDGPAIAFLLTIPTVFLVMTWILSNSLFSPLRTVSSYVKDATDSLESNKDVPNLPKELGSHMKESVLGKDDEFRDMLKGISGFVERINSNSKFTRRWTHQMIHELKTPLTILNHDIEAVAAKHQIPKEDLNVTHKSLNQISRTITNFLDWAELTYQGLRPNLYVVKISSAVNNVLPGLEKVYGQRINLVVKNEFQILCDPLHLEQLVNNLLTNALKYSKGGVDVRYGNNLLEISDKGPGLPESVMENLGSPFNKGPRSQNLGGSGLGLAWVSTVVDLYGWKMTINSTAQGTEIHVLFPTMEIS